MGLLRPEHIIKPNKKIEIPTRVIFFDTETKQRMVEPDLMNQTLRLGVACYYNTESYRKQPLEEWYNFVSPSDFWPWALSHVHEKKRLILIAHNLDFDFLVLNGLTQLKSWHWYAYKMIIANAVDIWSFVQYKYRPDSKQWDNYVIKHEKRPRIIKTILFLDMMNYFRMSLAELGKSMGFPKTKIDFANCTDEELEVYCRNDVYVMLQSWKKWVGFLKEYNLGVWGKTLPSQAFNAYRHRFMPHKIHIHSHEKTLNLERAGYFGGRTECFRIGHYDKGPYYLFDVNSMYAYVMRNNLFPTRMITYIRRGRVNDITNHIREKCIIATVLVETTIPAYPRRHNHRLTFPIGCFWTTLTTPELLHAMRHDHILAVRDMAIYDCESIFESYVDFFWTKRKEFREAGNLPYVELCKVLLNSLYGKFGQFIDDYQEIASDPTYGLNCWKDWDVHDQKWVKFKQLNGKVSVAMGKVESYNSFPAIAAHVTAYARQELLKYIISAGTDRIFYCDTDSLVVDAIGSTNLYNYISETELGALSLEKMSDTVTINNVKDYVFADKRKLKGITQKAKEIHPNVFGQWHQVGLRSVLWGDYTDNCFWKWVEKHLQEGYKKGTVSKSGVVTPYVLNESL